MVDDNNSTHSTDFANRDPFDIPYLTGILEEDEPEFEIEEDPDPEALREFIAAVESGEYDHITPDMTPFVRKVKEKLKQVEENKTDGDDGENRITVAGTQEEVSANELRQILAQVNDGDASKRLMVAITYKEIDGLTQEDAAKMFGFSSDWASKWFSRFERLTEEPFEKVVYDEPHEEIASKTDQEEQAKDLLKGLRSSHKHTHQKLVLQKSKSGDVNHIVSTTGRRYKQANEYVNGELISGAEHPIEREEWEGEYKEDYSGIGEALKKQFEIIAGACFIRGWDMLKFDDNVFDGSSNTEMALTLHLQRQAGEILLTEIEDGEIQQTSPYFPWVEHLL